jgi:hypothetical protein
MRASILRIGSRGSADSRGQMAVCTRVNGNRYGSGVGLLEEWNFCQKEFVFGNFRWNLVEKELILEKTACISLYFK